MKRTVQVFLGVLLWVLTLTSGDALGACPEYWVSIPPGNPLYGECPEGKEYCCFATNSETTNCRCFDLLPLIRRKPACPPGVDCRARENPTPFENPQSIPRPASGFCDRASCLQLCEDVLAN